MRKKYEFGLIVDHNSVCPTIVLFNSPTKVDGRPLYDKYLVNVKIHIKKNGCLIIDADEISHGFALHKTDIQDIYEEIVEADIEHDNGCKWLGIKPYDYVHGWYKLRKTTPVTYLLKDYKIKIIHG